MANHKTSFDVGQEVLINSTGHANEQLDADYRHLIGSQGKVLSIVIKEDGHSYVVATKSGNLSFKEWELEEHG